MIAYGRIGVPAPLLLMQSNGGLTTAEAATQMPMHIIESGPTAGVIGAQALARVLNVSNLITFDMAIKENQTCRHCSRVPFARPHGANSTPRTFEKGISERNVIESAVSKS